MLYSSRENIISKRIEPGATEFMMHTRANILTSEFNRSVKTTYKEFRKRTVA